MYTRTEYKEKGGCVCASNGEIFIYENNNSYNVEGSKSKQEQAKNKKR